MALNLRRNNIAFLALVQAVIGWEWLTAGWEKLTDSTFISSMGGTVAAFAGKNPNGAVSSFLTDVVEPHAEGYGYVVMYGEFLAGIGLLIGALALLVRFTSNHRTVEGSAFIISIAAAAGAFIMSFSYWEAAGWMSVSTSGLNFVMGLVEIVLIIAAAVYMTHLSHVDASARIKTTTALGDRLAEISGRRQPITTTSATGQSTPATPHSVHR